MSLTLESPLTAVDFDMDGVTMAVGTSRGKLLVYDLRFGTIVGCCQTTTNLVTPTQVPDHRASLHRSAQDFRPQPGVQAQDRQGQHQPGHVRRQEAAAEETTHPVVTPVPSVTQNRARGDQGEPAQTAGEEQDFDKEAC